eukprot:SAG31_NODE_6575_length_1966_cov_3.850027_1_plen_545_part_10
MIVYDTTGTLAEGDHDDHHFVAEQGLVYWVTEVPLEERLQRTEMELEAESSDHHHPLAQQMDVTKQSDGTHKMEWDAPEHIAAMDIHVAAIEGAGDYHLGVEIVGTVEMLSREAVIGRPVSVEIGCQLLDCTYHYAGLEMRGSGTDFTLKFKPTTGFTYNFTGVLQRSAGDATASAVHMQLAVFPPEAIASTDSNRAGGSDCAELPHDFRRPPHDVGNLTLGRFAAPSGGRQSWGEHHCAEGDSGCCAEPEHVGPPDAPCDGSYTHYPGQDFGDRTEWLWTCPLTGEYILQLTANCDVSYFADPTQPGCSHDADGLHCDDDTSESCSAGVQLEITTIDASVHMRHRFEVPIANVLGDDQAAVGGNAAAMAGLATLFRTDRQSGMAFPTSITPFDCDVPEHADRETCVRQAEMFGGAGSGGGGRHRRSRHRLQVQDDLASACPFDTFLTREQETQAACSLSGSLAADAAALGSVICPSRTCAEMLPALMEDCKDSIQHVSAEGQAYYTALKQSTMFVNCFELEQNTAEFAEIEVEFRAPSLGAVQE